MSGVLWAMQCVDLDRASPLAALLEMEIKPVAEWQPLTAAGSKTRDERLLPPGPLLCTAPETAVAIAVESGLDPEFALQQWLKEAETLIDLASSSETGPCFLFVEDAVDSISLFYEQVAQESGPERRQFATGFAGFTLPSRLAITLATQFVRLNPAVLAVGDRLRQASPIPRLSAGNAEIDVRETLADLGTCFSRLEEKAGVVAQYQEENRLLLSQLHQAEAALQATLSMGVRNGVHIGGPVNFRGPFLVQLVRAFKRIVNPGNPWVWRISAPIRFLSRPVRVRLKTILNG